MQTLAISRTHIGHERPSRCQGGVDDGTWVGSVFCGGAAPGNCVKIPDLS